MKKKDQTKLWLTMGIIVVIVVALIAVFSVQKQEEEVIKIGVILPLTGEAASWGQNALAGMKLAVNEINSKGGINGKKIELIVEDSKCSADSVSGVQKLVNVDKANAVVGFVCSAAAGPSLPILQKEGVPTILIAASAPHLTRIGDYIFRIYPSDTAQGKFAAEFIYNTLNKKKVAVLYVKNDWGQGLYDVFNERFKELGGEVVYSTGVLQTQTDFKTEITKIKRTSAEVLYFPVYPSNAVAALKQMKEFGLNITTIAGDITGAEEVVKSGYADGLLYTIGKISLPEEFKSKIKSLPEFKDLSINILAPLGYDGIKLMATAIKNANSLDPSLIITELSRIKYAGVSNPTIEFDENGDLKTAVFEVMMVKDKNSVEYTGG